MEEIAYTLDDLGKRLAQLERLEFPRSNYVMVGEIRMWPTSTAPTNWLLCYGQAISRTTYATLFETLCPSATVTITIASPGVVTWTSHPFVTGDRLRLTTTGALPTGLTANTDYYVIYVSANTFRLATSYANAYVPTPINTSGTQSGVHTGRSFWWGAGDGSTTFNLPDFRGRTPLGKDNMGGSSANRVTATQADNLGQAAGTETHTLVDAEMPVHTHVQNSHNHTQNSHNHTQNSHDHTAQGTSEGAASTSPNGTLPAVPGAANIYKNTGTGLVTMNTNHIAAQTATNIAQTATNIAQTATNQNAGGDTAHNNMPPYLTMNFIIRVL